MLHWFDLFTYLVIIFISLFVIYFKNYLKSVFLAIKLPGPANSVPFFGHALLVLDSQQMETIANEMPQKYGPIMKIWLGLVPFFFVIDPKYLQILIGNSKHTDKNMFYTFLHNFIGDGLITGTGEKWKQHRKHLQPHFFLNKLKCFFDSFSNCSDLLVNNLKGKKDVNITPFANQFVLDVLHETVLGIQASGDTPFRKGKLFVPYRVARPWLLFESLFKWTGSGQSEKKHKAVLQDYTRGILEERRRKPAETCNFLDTMIEISENYPEFTENDIINEASTLMLAGQDSVGASLVFTLYFLAKHQKIQEKVMDELRSCDETFEDLANLKYLEQCIKESMRLCPPVPIITRKLIRDTFLDKNHYLPKGCNIFVTPFVTHRIPEYFPEPLKFDPDRFSSENIGKIHPFAYVPFSAGPRNCIGYKFAMLELKTVISKLLRNYHISLAPGHENLVLNYRITLRAKGGIWLRINPRTPQS